MEKLKLYSQDPTNYSQHSTSFWQVPENRERYGSPDLITTISTSHGV